VDVRKADNLYEVEFVVLTPVDRKIRVLRDMAPYSVVGRILPFYCDGSSTIVNSGEQI
jgi:hypothetical protein